MSAMNYLKTFYMPKCLLFLLMIDGVNSMIIALYNTYNKFKCSSTKSNLYYTMNTFYNNTTMIILEWC